MVAYFDLENLKSFLQQPKDDFFHDCLKLIKKQLDLTFNFKKEDLKSSEAGLQLLKSLSEGVGEKEIKYNEEKFPVRTLKSTTHNTFSTEELLSVYFINDESIDKLKNREELLIADIGEEMEMFKQLFLNNEDYKFEKKLLIGSEFDAWEKLNSFYAPFIDLIIVDNYILSDNSLLESNICELAKYSLLPGVRKQVNIIVFTKDEKSLIDYSSVKSKISKAVKAHCQDEPKLTIIKHRKEHDRTVLKNHIRIYSGDSFNYFFQDGNKTTNGREISFSSIADKENYKLYLKLLDDLQNTIDNSIAANIIGDKKSRFLKFN